MTFILRCNCLVTLLSYLTHILADIRCYCNKVVSIKDFMAIHKIYYSDREDWLIKRGLLSGEKNENPCRLGASQVATCMGLNKYESPLRLFSKLIGDWPSDFNSEKMTMGLVMEPTIIMRRETYDADEQIMLSNVNNGIVTTKGHKPDYIITNDLYPYLFVSIDYVIDAIDGEQSYPVELKNTTNATHSNWKDGISKEYNIQVQTQMMAMGATQGELCCLIDGFHFILKPVEQDLELQATIRKTVSQFCAMVNGFKELRRKIGQAAYDHIAQFEPELDGLEDTTDFLKSKYSGSNYNSFTSTDNGITEHFENYIRSCEEIKDSELVKNYSKNHLLTALGNYEYMVSLGGSYKITYKRGGAKRDYFSIKQLN